MTSQETFEGAVWSFALPDRHHITILEKPLGQRVVRIADGDGRSVLDVTKPATAQSLRSQAVPCRDSHQRGGIEPQRPSDRIRQCETENQPVSASPTSGWRAREGPMGGTDSKDEGPRYGTTNGGRACTTAPPASEVYGCQPGTWRCGMRNEVVIRLGDSPSPRA